jgi:hypothetical protein
MEYFEMISPRLLRFPAIDADSFRKRVETMVEELNNEN